MASTDLLEGITVIDFTRLLPGPMATHLLAQMGAKVIKVESPKRIDYARLLGKQVDGAGVLFHQLNYKKEIVSIDYATPEGINEVEELVKNADVFIEQFRPGAMDAWGLGYEAMKKVNPSIIYVSMTGYGSSSVLAKEAGHDFNYLAYSGLMSMLKDDSGKPVVPDFQLADISGAYMAIIALQGALLKRFRTGKGAFVDVAIADAVLPFMAIPFSFQASEMNFRNFNVINGKLAANYAPYQCKDEKWLSVAALELKFWNKLCEVLNKKQWQRSNQVELLNVNFPKLEVQELFLTKDRKSWIELFTGFDVCVAPILDLGEIEEMDYHKQSNNFTEFTTENGTVLKAINLPFKVI